MSNCAGASYATEKSTPVRILIALLGSIRAFRLKVLLSSICALRVLNVLLIREREGWGKREMERERERERGGERETERESERQRRSRNWVRKRE